MFSCVKLWRAVLLTLLCAVSLNLLMAQQPAGNTPTTDITKVLPDVLTMIGRQETGPLQIKPGDTMAFMGDSITVQAGFLRLVAYVLKTRYPELKPGFIYAGVSGHKSDDMVPRFERDMRLAEKPTWAFINVGINDVWQRLYAPHNPAVLETYKANVANMVDKAQAAGSRVVLLTPTIFQEDAKNEGNTRLLLYVDAMKQVAAEKKCDIIDLHAMFLNALTAKPASVRLTVDGVHMGLYGDAIMAYGVLRALGVADATIAATPDIPSIFVIRNTNFTLTKFAQLLEVPPSRFFGKQELLDLLAF